MNIESMVKQLQKAGIHFIDGLNQNEITQIEQSFNFRFPKEISDFLSYAYPVDPKFFPFKNISEDNVALFNLHQKLIKEAFIYDLEYNYSSLKALFGNINDDSSHAVSVKNSILQALDNSPHLIPFYGHRYFFDGMDNMPIVSFSQPVDTIIYGSNFENYLQNEFLSSEFHIEKITEKIKDTGIWYYLIS